MIKFLSCDDSDGGGIRSIIVVCPLCGAARGEDWSLYPAHLKEHSWDDLTLDNSRPEWAGQRSRYAVQPPIQDP